MIQGLIKRILGIPCKYMLIKSYERKKGCKIFTLSVPNDMLKDERISEGVSIGRKVEFVGDYSCCRIGRYTYISSGYIENAIIGSFCSIANNVTIGPGNHKTQTLSTYPIFARVLKSNQNSDFETEEPAVIGNDVWIGQNAVIMSGVKVGNGAVVAAGAVVTRDIPPYQIWGGVPAKLIRVRFNEEKIHWIESVKWWEQSIEWIRDHQDYFM